MPKKKEVAKSGGVLDVAIEQLNKKYGKGTLMLLSADPLKNIDSIDTGSLNLNDALGVGGWPMGRMIEIFGNESSGKSTLALHAIASAQKRGLKAAFIDVEHALKRGYAERIGVDPDNMYLSQPNSGVEALDIIETLIKTDECGIVVLDSVDALVSEAEMERKIGDANVAELPKLMSQAMRHYVGAVSKSNTCLIFVNQIRTGNLMGYGAKNTTSGGKALKFYSSVRVQLTKMKTIEEKKRPIGILVRAQVVKNKVAPPFMVCEFPLLFEKGISVVDEAIDAAINSNLITARGAYLDFKEQAFHGRAALRQHLLDTDDDLKFIIQEKDKLHI